MAGLCVPLPTLRRRPYGRLRTARGRCGLATPSSYRTCTDCSLPVSRRTAKDCGHYRGHLRTERRDARGPRLVVQEAVDAFLHEPLLPAPDAGLRLAGPAHDLVGANTVGAREDDRRPPSVFLRGATVSGDRFKSAADGP